MLVKIINGGVGLDTGHGVILKTAKDKPFVVDDAVARRWIAQGAAVEAGHCEPAPAPKAKKKGKKE